MIGRGALDYYVYLYFPAAGFEASTGMDIESSLVVSPVSNRACVLQRRSELVTRIFQGERPSPPTSTLSDSEDFLYGLTANPDLLPDEVYATLLGFSCV